ncbi:hypothetical protein HanIR_Chr13g0628241 [Helianthus annuus]|nr:hypothetical protein HanIR_Chr13g0628241 [Helianthus annuus]
MCCINLLNKLYVDFKNVFTGGTTRWVKEDQRAISLLGWGLLHRLARFLNIVAQEEIEEPMWADLSVCDSTNDETYLFFL